MTEPAAAGPRYRSLISPAELLALRAAPADLVILDCGFELSDPAAGQRAYAQAHLPGALYAHLEHDLAGAKTGTNGRHPLPARADLAARLGAWGIGKHTQVVTYDAQGGPYAARAWWALRWMGHEAVAVLDGGRAAWQAAGGALEAGVPVPRRLDVYPARPAAMPVVEVDALQAAMARGEARIVDARSGERYRGEVEPLDAVPGHIPGAINRFYKDNLDDAGRFKAGTVLRAEFARLGLDAPTAGTRVVHQCGSGVTACHNLLAMAHAGLDGTALYPGSWSEWCADPARPVARG